MEILANNYSMTTVESEILIVGVSKHQQNIPEWQNFVHTYGEKIPEWLKDGDIDVRAKRMTKIPNFTSTNVKRILYVGLDNRKACTLETLRQTFGLVGKQLTAMRIQEAAIWLDSFQIDRATMQQIAQVAIEGMTMGAFTVENYKTTSNLEKRTLKRLKIITEQDEKTMLGFSLIGRIYGQAVNEARHLVNLPANILTAPILADEAVALAQRFDFDVEVLEKRDLEELGMGAILAVNQGSTIEPRLITLKYQGKETWEDEDVLALVGKGVTFDTGGYSIKSKSGLVGMKVDMGGAASLLGAMQIIGQLKPKYNVMAVIAATDNMISSNAFKPDDVITTYSGKTVEILNTDAEGRLILADAVTYALQQGATSLIDLATLTGGVITALGFDKTGALTNDDAFYTSFVESAKQADEFVWQLPLTEGDRRRIRRSDVADLNNSPGRDGHMIFGGGFIGEFVGQTPWIHLDIAGTTAALAPHDLGPKGGTGVMVRTLANFVLNAQNTN